MSQLFGLNIAAIVDGAIQQAGGVKTGTLTKSAPGTRTPGSVTGGTNPTPTAYSFRGFVENRTSQRRPGELVKVSGEFVSILGNSLPAGVEPEANDLVAIEGTEYTVTGVVERDPASALYVLSVSS